MFFCVFVHDQHGIHFRKWVHYEHRAPLPIPNADKEIYVDNGVLVDGGISRCTASECLLFHKDLQSLGLNRIFINGNVKV